jgi:hypothetical protein
MFNDSQIPSNEIMTRYIAPFGLTALLRPSKPGQSVDSFWVGSQGDSGIVLFVSALDAEIYRAHALTVGQKWERRPLEQIGFQYSVAKLGQAWTNLAFAFNANARSELVLGKSGCCLLPYYPECFGPLEEPTEPTIFKFPDYMFETMIRRWTVMGEPNHAETIAKINALGTTKAGAVELREIAERALKRAWFGPVGEPSHELTDYATFNPNTSTWRFGPNENREILH